MTRTAIIGVVAWWLVIVAGLTALTVSRVTVQTTPTAIYTSAGGGNSRVLIRNAGAAAVYLGSVMVTTATGFELPAGDAVTLFLEQANDTVYGVVTSGTVVVHVLDSNR